MASKLSHFWLVHKHTSQKSRETHLPRAYCVGIISSILEQETHGSENSTFRIRCRFLRRTVYCAAEKDVDTWRESTH